MCALPKIRDQAGDEIGLTGSSPDVLHLPVPLGEEAISGRGGGRREEPLRGLMLQTVLETVIRVLSALAGLNFPA